MAIVTGGARGIGAAIVERLRRGGRAGRPIADISLAQAEETADARRQGVRRRDRRHQAASIERRGRQVVSDGAASTFSSTTPAIFDMAPIVEVTEASYDKVFAVNVKGLFFTSRPSPST